MRQFVILASAAVLVLLATDRAAQAQTSSNQPGPPVLVEGLKILGLATDATKDRNIQESKRAEYFANVGSLRRQIARIIPELVTKIGELEKEKTDLDEKVTTLEDQITELNDLRKKDKDDLQQEVDEKNEEVQRLTLEQRNLPLPASEPDEAKRKELTERRRDLANRLFRAQSAEKSARAELEKYDQSATALSEAKDKLAGYRTHRAYSEYEQGRNLLRALQNQRDMLDEFANSLLDIEKARNEFTLWATAAFSALVGVVIVMFFLVVLLYADVRVNVFTGDAAIQFVTIFSLVIAIILFGVLRILEGKELAALLGGLSGYILGRGTISRAPPPAEDGAGTGQPAGTATR